MESVIYRDGSLFQMTVTSGHLEGTQIPAHTRVPGVIKYGVAVQKPWNRAIWSDDPHMRGFLAAPPFCHVHEAVKPRVHWKEVLCLIDPRYEQLGDLARVEQTAVAGRPTLYHAEVDKRRVRISLWGMHPGDAIHVGQRVLFHDGTRIDIVRERVWNALFPLTPTENQKRYAKHTSLAAPIAEAIR